VPDEKVDLAFNSPPVLELTDAAKTSLEELASEVTGGTSESQEGFAGDTPVVPDTGDAEESGDLESEETPELLTIDKANISQGISDAIASDSEFANIFNSRVGAAARTKYQPEIDKLTGELAVMQGAQVIESVEGMSAEERGRAFTEQPQLAIQYDAARNAQQNQNTNASVQQLRNSILNLSSLALDKGMSEEKLNEFMDKANSGGYDLDEQGNPYADWTGPYHSLEREVMGELLDSRPSTLPESPEKKSKPADTATPDMGTARRSSNGDSPAKYTIEEVRKMTPPQQFKAFGEEEGAIEKAIQAGIISGSSEATQEVLGLT
jgi:hypothetical protein